MPINKTVEKIVAVVKKDVECMDGNYILFQFQGLKGRIISLCVKALAHYKDFHKDFSENVFVKIIVHI